MKKLIVSALATIGLFTFIASAALPPEPEQKDFTPEFVQRCKERAEKGEAEGQALYGRALSNGWGVEKDEKSAIEWLTKAAESGNAMGQCTLGVCYKNGQGVEKDVTKAVEWFTRAAEQGFPRAQCSLGVCYIYGQGVAKDETKAAEWYTKAAEQGLPEAQCNLGECYRYGEGVEKNEAKAFEWYTKAAEQGNRLAKEKLQQKWQIDEAWLKNSERQKEEANATPSTPKVGIGPKIKGMQIGMDIDEALRKYSALRHEYFRTPEDTYAFQTPLGDPDSLFDLNKDAVMRFRGLDGNAYDGVTRILFTKEDFNAGSLSDDDFVQKFIDAYGIPKMTHREISGKEFCDLLGTVKIGGFLGTGGNGERVSVDFNTKGCRCHSYRFDCGVEVSAIYIDRRCYICVRKVVADSGLKFD